MDKPYYVIDFSAVNCLLDIRVNDVSVLCMDISGNISTIVPINQAILESGKQHISYNILPLLGTTTLKKNTSLIASVWLYDASGEFIEKKEEITKKFIMPENSAGILPAYKGEDFFIATVPYKLDAWQNSQDLTKVEDLRLYVDLFYNEVEEMIANGQYNQFAKLIQKRENNTATCMYLSEEEKEERITELIEMIKTERLKVVPTSNKDIMLIYGYDKLVSLKKPDGDSALVLRNDEGDELSLDIQLHLPQGSTDLLVI